MGQAPLEGLRVVDFSRLFAGPLCTMTLADLGAEVIKVESPGGDDARRFGPPFLGGEGMNFMALNRGKESVVLDLKTEPGQQAVQALCATSDIVVENFRPGVAERIGIGYGDLAEGRDDLVYCSISGFGPARELDRRPALDLIVQAVTGLMARQAGPDGSPRLLCVTVGDTYAAAQAVQGILAALLVRERTGMGQKVEVSLLEAILAAQTYRIICDPETMDLPAWDDTIPYQAFEASDGDWLAVAVVSPANWTALCDSLGREDLADDPRFRSNPDRVEHRDELIPQLEEEFARRTRVEWLETLEPRGVPCAPVQGLDELMADDAMLSTGVLCELDHPTAGRIRTIGTGVRLSETPGRPGSAAPRVGEHTAEVLSRLDLPSQTLRDCLEVAK